MSNTLRYVSPEPYIPILSDKIHYFQKHKNEFNTVFIGSSHVYRGISPIVFDTELAKSNFKSKSFNFGVPAMNLIEQRFLLKTVLNEKPKNLKYIFVEPLLELKLAFKNLETARVSYFSNWQNTSFAIAYIANLQNSLFYKIKQASAFTLAFMRHLFNVGTLSSSIFDNTSINRTGELKLTDFSQQGFFALDDERNKRLEQNRRDFLKDVDKYKHLLTQNYLLSKSQKRLFSPMQLNVIKEMREDVGKINAQTIFIIPPGFTDIIQASQVAGTLKAKPRDFTFFNYYQGQNSDFKEIYQQQYWFDEFHLNKAGAKVFSTKLAKDFVNLVSNGIS